MPSTIELPSKGVQARQAIGLTACPPNLLRKAAIPFAPKLSDCRDRKRIRSGSASTGAAFSLHDWRSVATPPSPDAAGGTGRPAHVTVQQPLALILLVKDHRVESSHPVSAPQAMAGGAGSCVGNPPSALNLRWR